MLLFHCSQAAIEGLTFTRKGQQKSWVTPAPLPKTDALTWDWHLHQVTIERKRVWVAMEQQSRFAVVLWDIKKGDGNGLYYCFYQRLANHLYWMVISLGLLDEQQAISFVPHLLPQLEPVHFLPGSDRSVQAHINDVVQACRLAVDEQECLPNNEEQAAKFDLYLNQTPRRVQGGPYIFPDEQWLCLLLERLAGHHQITSEAVKAAFSSARRAYWGLVANK